MDPFSESYLLEVKGIYEAMRGHSYVVDDEANIFDFSTTEPSPYSSRHPHLICSHVGSIVTVIRDLGKLPPARALDLGFGAGDTSLMLARCGFSVDAVDVNAGYVELLGYWAKRMHVEDRINVVKSQFDELDMVVGPYDVVMFFESFHHSLRHADLISTVAAKLKPDGVIIFAGEPIYDHFPVPWGLRHVEGLATYCIRKFGWMELGFNRSYFLELLEQNGLYATYKGYSEYPVANHYRAYHITTGIPILDLCVRKPYESGWLAADGDMRWTTGPAGLPLALFKGTSELTLELQNLAPMPLEVTIRADAEVLTHTTVASGALVTLTAKIPSAAHELWIDVPSWSPLEIGLSTDDRNLGISVKSIRKAA
jgi:SAM-dependent methyltransferase